MNTNDLRDLSVDELVKKQADLKEEQFNLRFQKHTGQLENTAALVRVKKDIARVMTILGEKRQSA